MTPRLEFEPLAGEAPTSNVGQLAEMIGVTRRTIHRWARDGVPASKADHAAIAVGSHPAYVWADQWATT